MQRKPRYITRNVLMTSFTSFFTDISSEMMYPIIQAFVRSITVSVGPVLGVMEGVAESMASLIKVLSGYYSDKKGERKPLTILGYSLSALSKVLFFVPSVLSLFFVRFFDKVGKGIRTAPRDALISDSVPRESLGKAFGFQRSWDYAGAFVGTILIYFLIARFLPNLNNVVKGKGAVAPSEFYPVFAIVVASALVAVIFLFFTKDEKARGSSPAKEAPKPNLDFRKYDKNLQFFFLSQLVFTLGNSSNQFLLLQSTNITGMLTTVLLMYLLFNLTTFCFSSLFGGMSDRHGRKKFLVIGYLLYTCVYVGFGLIAPESSMALWFFWPLYGMYYAMTDGVEKAFVTETAPFNSRATALGLYNMIIGIGLLPASVLAGLLFAVDPRLPFMFGGLMSLSAVMIIIFFVKEQRD